MTDPTTTNDKPEVTATKCDWCGGALTPHPEEPKLVYATELTTGWCRIPATDEDTDAWDMYDGDNDSEYLCDKCRVIAWEMLEEGRRRARS